jgi:uncharacterized protein (DUF433 family)
MARANCAAPLTGTFVCHLVRGEANSIFLQLEAESIDMAKRDTRRIARDLVSEPHIRGRRISVRQVYALVEERGEDAEAVADRYDLDVADVYHALAYYHDHPREMREVEQERASAIEEIREEIDRPEDVAPDVA